MRAHLLRRDVAARVDVHRLKGLGEPLVALVDGRGKDLLESSLATERLQRRLQRALAHVADLIEAVLGAVADLADSALEKIGAATNAALQAPHQPVLLWLDARCLRRRWPGAIGFPLHGSIACCADVEFTSALDRTVRAFLLLLLIGGGRRAVNASFDEVSAALEDLVLLSDGKGALEATLKALHCAIDASFDEFSAITNAAHYGPSQPGRLGCPGRRRRLGCLGRRRFGVLCVDASVDLIGCGLGALHRACNTSLDEICATTSASLKAIHRTTNAAGDGCSGACCRRYHRCFGLRLRLFLGFCFALGRRQLEPLVHGGLPLQHGGSFAINGGHRPECHGTRRGSM